MMMMMQKWINANKLTINFDPKKSSHCIFKARGKCFKVNFDRGLKMGSNVPKYKETKKNLGLILDINTLVSLAKYVIVSRRRATKLYIMLS